MIRVEAVWLAVDPLDMRSGSLAWSHDLFTDEVNGP